jgi:hypothetical protein
MDMMMRACASLKGRVLGVAIVLTATIAVSATAVHASAAQPATGAALPAPRPVAALARAATGPGNQFLYGFNSGFDINAGSNPGRGTLVSLRPPSSTGRPDTWLLKANGTIHLYSRPRLCLDLPGRSYSGSVHADLRRCDSRIRERFVIRKPSAHSSVLFIVAEGERSMCLNAPGLYEDQSITLAPCSGIDSEAWSNSDLKGYVSPISAGASAALTEARPGGLGSHVVHRPLTDNIRQYWLVNNDSTFDSLSPVGNTAQCMTVVGGEKLNAALAVQRCHNASDDSFLAIIMGTADSGLDPVPYLLTTADAQYCLSASGGAGTGYGVQLRRCDASAPMLWSTFLKLVLNQFFLGYQFQAVHLGSAVGPLSMTAPPSGAGGDVSLSASRKTPFQIWTTVPPGGTSAGNPDGSTSLRPLSDLDLCLTMPAGYSANVPLQALPCTAAADQKFLLISAGPPTSFSVEIVAFADGQSCVGAAASDQAIVLNSCDYASDQSWGTRFILNSPVRITDLAGSDALALSNPGSDGGDAAIASLATLRTDQVWVQTQATGGYTFRSAYDTAWCLNAPSYAPGTQLTIQQCDGSARQVFAVAGDLISPIGASSMCLSATSPVTAGQPATLQPCSTADASEMWSIWNAST